MANLVDLYADVGACLIGDDSTATFRVENTSTGNVLDLRALGAGVNIINAVASAGTVAVMNIGGLNLGFVSTNSTASLAYAFRVRIGGAANGQYWVPVYTGAA